MVPYDFPMGFLRLSYVFLPGGTSAPLLPSLPASAGLGVSGPAHDAPMWPAEVLASARRS